MTNRKYELTAESKKLSGGVTLYRIRALRDFADVKKGQLGGFVEDDCSNLSHVGNAWVHDNAKVFGFARVIGNARVYDNATVKGHARVIEGAKVSDVAVISGYAEVCGCTMVRGGATVQGHARVLGFARIEGKAIIKGHAWVQGDALVTDDAVIGALTNLGGSTCVSNHSKILIRGDAPAGLSSNAVIRGDASIVRPNDIVVISSLGSRYDRLTAYLNEQGGIDVTTGCFHGPLSEFKKQVQFTHGGNLYGKQYRAAVAFIETFFEIGKGIKKS